MVTHLLTYEEEGISACVTGTMEAFPENYIHCKNEEELRETLNRQFQRKLTYEDFTIFDSEYPYVRIPDGFIEEWLKLKENG